MGLIVVDPIQAKLAAAEWAAPTAAWIPVTGGTFQAIQLSIGGWQGQKLILTVFPAGVEALLAYSKTVASALAPVPGKAFAPKRAVPPGLKLPRANLMDDTTIFGPTSRLCEASKGLTEILASGNCLVQPTKSAFYLPGFEAVQDAALPAKACALLERVPREVAKLELLGGGV